MSAKSSKDTPRQHPPQPQSVQPAAIWQMIQKYPLPYHQCHGALAIISFWITVSSPVVLNRRPRTASGLPAPFLWPPNYCSFTMCFSWVSTCILGLVSMPMIHRQLGHSLLQAQFCFLSLSFLKQFAYSHFAGCRSLDCTTILCSKFTAKRKEDSENRHFKEELTEKCAFILPPTSTRCA